MTGYPACAGIDPITLAWWVSLVGLPRMRGDRPVLAAGVIEDEPATPHARGSTLIAAQTTLGRLGYPACVGIDPA